MLPTKCRVSWPFSSEEDMKIRFSRWPLSWISDWNDFSYFFFFFFLYLHVIPMLPTKFQVSWLSGLGVEAKKMIFKTATMAAILDF